MSGDGVALAGAALLHALNMADAAALASINSRVLALRRAEPAAAGSDLALERYLRAAAALCRSGQAARAMVEAAGMD
jgi:hypothetical protein